MVKFKVLGRIPATVAVCALAAVVASVSASARTHADTFKIGVITGINTISSNAPELPDSLQIAAAAMNKKGGIGGKQIEIVPCSSQSSATVVSQCARMMVDQGVDDVIQSHSLGAASDPILDAAGIPQIGGLPQAPSDYRNKLTFPVVSGALQEAIIGAYAMMTANKGLKRWAAFGQQAVATSNNVNTVRTVVTRAGRQWVGTVLFPATTDLTPFVQQVKGMSPDIVFQSLSQAPTIAYYQAAASLGLNAKTVSVAQAVGEAEMSTAPDKGATLMQGAALPPYTATNVQAVRLWLADLKAAGKDSDPTLLKERSFVAWMDLQAIKKLSLTVKGTVTAQSLLAAARATKKPIDLFGLVKWCPGCKGPAAYPQASSGIGYAVKFVNGKPTLAQKAPIDAWKVLGLTK